MVISAMNRNFASIWLVLVIVNLIVLPGRSTEVKSCPDVPGVTYSPCPSYSPNPIADAGPYHDEILSAPVDCDTQYTFGDVDPGRYKIEETRATQAYVTLYDLDIPVSDRVYMRRFYCNDQCVHVTLDSNAKAPLTFLTEDIRWQVHAGDINSTSFKFTVNPIMDCEVGWVNHCDLCYKYFDDTPMVWQRAQEHCRKQGGNLAIVAGKPIDVFLDTITDTDVWIGLSDSEEEKRYRWINGSGSAYRSWASGHPRNNSVTDTDCIEKAKLSTPLNTWRDEYCWETKDFVCEKYGVGYNTIQVDSITTYTFTAVANQSYYIYDPDDATSYSLRSETLYIPENDTLTLIWGSSSPEEYTNSSGSLDTGSNNRYFVLKTDSDGVELTFYILPYYINEMPCESGWEEWGDDCYKFEQHYRTYVDASSECSWLSASLVTPESFRENDFVTGLVDEDVWIGMDDLYTEELWSNSGGFYAWHANNPENNGAELDCGYIVKEVADIAWTHSPHGLNWHNADCNETKRYVCTKRNTYAQYESYDEVSECTVNVLTTRRQWFFTYYDGDYHLTNEEVPVVEIIEATLPSGSVVQVKPSDCQSYNCYYKTFFSSQSLPLLVPTDEVYFSLEGNQAGIVVKFQMTAAKLCALGWIKHGARCYKFIRKRATWDDAKVDCARYEAVLATARCNAVNDKLAAHVEKDTWIGLRKEPDTANYTWDDGWSISWETEDGNVYDGVSRLPWDSSQPEAGNADRACGKLELDSSSGSNIRNFATAGCNTNKYEYICQKNVEYDPQDFINPTTCSDYTLANISLKFFDISWNVLELLVITNIDMFDNVTVTIESPDCLSPGCVYLTFNSTTPEPVKLMLPKMQFVILAHGGVASMDVKIDSSGVCEFSIFGRSCDACHLFANYKRTFEAAISECRDFNAALPSIHDTTYNTFLLDNIVEDSWIGLKNTPDFRNATLSVDNWEWLDDSSLDYNQWHSNRSIGSGVQDCGYLILKNASHPWRNIEGKHWDDDDCGALKTFVCSSGTKQPLDTPCQASADCKTTAMECINNICQCQVGMVRIDDACEQTVLLRGGCYDSRQCTENGKCVDGNCGCDDGHVEILDLLCYPELNLEQECEYSEQCSTTTANSECSTGVTPVCTCISPLVKSKIDTCIPATISVEINQDLAYRTFDSTMLTVGSGLYEAVKIDLENIYSNRTANPFFVSITDLVISNDGFGNVATTFTFTSKNPEAASRRTKREITDGNEQELDVVEHAKKLGSKASNSVEARIAKGGLYGYCLSADDCAYEGASCFASTCSCTSSIVKNMDGKPVCK